MRRPVTEIKTKLAEVNVQIDEAFADGVSGKVEPNANWRTYTDNLLSLRWALEWALDIRNDWISPWRKDALK